MRKGHALLAALQASSRLRCIATQDIVYVPRRPVNNAFSWLDRGRFCRRPETTIQTAVTTQIESHGRKLS